MNCVAQLLRSYVMRSHVLICKDIPGVDVPDGERWHGVGWALNRYMSDVAHVPHGGPSRG